VTGYKDPTATWKQTCYLLTYLLCSQLCSPPGTGADLGGGTGPVPPPKEDWCTPPKLPKLEHVALNSASETGAKMHQNAQICKLNFLNFLGRPHTGEWPLTTNPGSTLTGNYLHPHRGCAPPKFSVHPLKLRSSTRGVSISATFCQGMSVILHFVSWNTKCFVFYDSRKIFCFRRNFVFVF